MRQKIYHIDEKFLSSSVFYLLTNVFKVSLKYLFNAVVLLVFSYRKFSFKIKNRPKNSYFRNSGRNYIFIKFSFEKTSCHPGTEIIQNIHFFTLASDFMLCVPNVPQSNLLLYTYNFRLLCLCLVVYVACLSKLYATTLFDWRRFAFR